MCLRQLVWMGSLSAAPFVVNMAVDRSCPDYTVPAHTPWQLLLLLPLPLDPTSPQRYLRESGVQTHPGLGTARRVFVPFSHGLSFFISFRALFTIFSFSSPSFLLSDSDMLSWWAERALRLSRTISIYLPSLRQEHINRHRGCVPGRNLPSASAFSRSRPSFTQQGRLMSSVTLNHGPA